METTYTLNTPYILRIVLGGILGLLVGLTNLRLLERTVAIVRPEISRNAILTVVLGSFALRLGFIGLILFLTLQQGFGFLLFTFVGIWLSRWRMIKMYYNGKVQKSCHYND